MKITFASSKGGVGKSTTCACIGAALADKGAAVHITDLDANGTLARWARDFPLDTVNVHAISPDDLDDHLTEKEESGLFDHILIDIAGVYDKALLMALMSSDFVVIPAKLSEPDLIEAGKVVADIRALEKRLRAELPFRLLLNEVDPLPTKVMRHIVGEIDDGGLPRFKTMITKRTIYRQLFLNGQPPHAALNANPADEAARKAVTELDAVLAEIDAITAAEPALLKRAG